MNIDELKSLLSRFHIRPSKKLGQNFLLSEGVLDEIVEAAELKSDDFVLEIGPGLGFLTRRLSEKAGLVLAVEKDRKLALVLRKLFKSKKNVKVIHADALFFDPLLVRRGRGGHIGFTRTPSSSPPHEGEKAERSYKIVANIPYYLTGIILQKFLQGDANIRIHPNDTNIPSPDDGEGKGEVDLSSNPSPSPGEEGRDMDRSPQLRPSLMVLLLQKEVAERIVAKPGQMSILSMSVQFYADPEIIAYVPKENFYPVPEVDSAIVKLRVLPEPRLDVNAGKFFQLVKIGFSNKRKQLQNNLQALLPLPQSLPPGERKEVENSSPLRGEGRVGVRRIDFRPLLSSIGINPLARAQDLSLEDWKKLYDATCEGGK